MIPGITGRTLLPYLAKQYDKEKVKNLTEEQKEDLVKKLEGHKDQQSKARRVTAVGTAMAVENNMKSIETQVRC